jgi:thymidylate kinase
LIFFIGVIMISKFITVEGIDGSGKSTVSKFISDHLESLGIGTLVVQAYPKDDEAMFMRDLWIQQKIPMPAVLSCILKLRHRVLVEQIIPALLVGKTVITDRWNDTTWVYQHYTQGIPRTLMNAMFDYHLDLHTVVSNYHPIQAAQLLVALQGYETIHLDITLATSRARVGERTATMDAFEKSPDKFFEDLISNFEFHYQHRSKLCGPLHMVDANQSLDTVKAAIVDIFKVSS